MGRSFQGPAPVVTAGLAVVAVAAVAEERRRQCRVRRSACQRLSPYLSSCRSRKFRRGSSGATERPGRELPPGTAGRASNRAPLLRSRQGRAGPFVRLGPGRELRARAGRRHRAPRPDRRHSRHNGPGRAGRALRRAREHARAGAGAAWPQLRGYCPGRRHQGRQIVEQALPGGGSALQQQGPGSGRSWPEPAAEDSSCSHCGAPSQSKVKWHQPRPAWAWASGQEARCVQGPGASGHAPARGIPQAADGLAAQTGAGLHEEGRGQQGPRRRCRSRPRSGARASTGAPARPEGSPDGARRRSLPSSSSSSRFIWRLSALSSLSTLAAVSSQGAQVAFLTLQGIGQLRSRRGMCSASPAPYAPARRAGPGCRPRRP